MQQRYTPPTIGNSDFLGKARPNHVQFLTHRTTTLITGWRERLDHDEELGGGMPHAAE